ncbi:MAG: hypothetical protein BMS9Abin37_2211 [Acidobacteriota bacterium]|nr:MAG: hypothetical protein BMS9Abin37_2211 [Acidobacteriota bacterium]
MKYRGLPFALTGTVLDELGVELPVFLQVVQARPPCQFHLSVRFRF